MEFSQKQKHRSCSFSIFQFYPKVFPVHRVKIPAFRIHSVTSSPKLPPATRVAHFAIRASTDASLQVYSNFDSLINLQEIAHKPRTNLLKGIIDSLRRAKLKSSPCPGYNGEVLRKILPVLHNRDTVPPQGEAPATARNYTTTRASSFVPPVAGYASLNSYWPSFSVRQPFPLAARAKKRDGALVANHIFTDETGIPSSETALQEDKNEEEKA